MDADRMNRLAGAAFSGKTAEEMGVKAGEEQEFWDACIAERASLPAGASIELVSEIPDMAGIVVKDAPDPSRWGQEYEDAEVDSEWESMVKAYERRTQSISLVSKSVEEDRFTLGPMYVPNRIDAHNEWTDPDELQKAVWDYVRKGDRRIRLQHNKDIVAGEWVEVMAFPYETTVPMTKADGSTVDTTFPANTVYLGVVWEPWAWEMVKAGKLTGYSVGGKAQRIEVDLPSPVDKAEGDSCPPATRDIALNLKNRQEAIKKAAYGPLNPAEPNEEFWKDKADRWNVTIADAKKSKCGNCAAFVRTTKMLDCIESGIAAGGSGEEDAWNVIDAGGLGYCEAWDFKCAASRTCNAWITGGPITDETVKKDDPTVSDVHVDTVSGSEADSEQSKNGKRRKRLLVDPAAEPVVKHPGHPDQKVHAGRKGSASSDLPEIPDKPANSSRSPEAVAAATALRERVAAVEPELTGTMLSLAADHGGTLVGLQHRMKTTDSLARKIDAEKHEQLGDVQATADKMSDVVRYTVELPTESYGSGASGVLSSLEAQGCTLRAKNYWANGDAYQGVNVAVTHPSGVTFEVQFHTKGSLELKSKTHKIYDVYRQIPTVPENTRKRWKLYDRMARMALRMPKPQGTDAPILGGSKFLPFTIPGPGGKPIAVPAVRT